MIGYLYRLSARFKALFQKGSLDKDFREEIAFHLESLEEEFVQRGMSRGEARKKARIELGGIEQTRELQRETRSALWLENLVMDVRFGFRQIFKAPGFALIVVAALAIGVGACTTIFSVIESTMIRPLPVRDQDKLFVLWENHPERGIERFSVSYPNFRDYRDLSELAVDVVAMRGASATVNLDGYPERLEAMQVSPGILQVIGWNLLKGRDFLPGEAETGAAKVVMVGEGFWRNKLGGRADVIGTRIQIDRDSYEVVGVFSDESHQFNGEVEIWFPLVFRENRDSRDNHDLTVCVRLEDGVSAEQAQAEMDTIAAQLREMYPESNEGWGVYLESFESVITPKEVKVGLIILLAGVGVLLLITCANVSNLLLSRISLRGREISVRMALGAKRSRIVRQLLSEIGIYCVLGAVVGTILSFWGVAIVRMFAPTSMMRTESLSVNWLSLLFAVAVCLFALVVSGIVPALRGAKSGSSSSLGTGGRVLGSIASDGKLRSGLVVLQLALSLTLVVGAALLASSLWKLQQVDLGYQTEGVLTFRITPDQEAYGTGEKRTQFFEEGLRRLKALPGVRSVGISSAVPFGPGRTGLNVFSEDPSAVDPEDSIQSAWRIVSPRYFNTVGIPLLEGRTFERFDDWQGEPTMIISESLAKRFWPEESALGKRLNPGGGDGIYTVVGVVGEARLGSITSDSSPSMYFSLWNWWGWHTMNFVVRSDGDLDALIPAIREVVKEIDPNQPVFEFNHLDAYLSEQYKLPRLNSWLLGLFAFAALFLAAIGVYGVMASSVDQRSNEIGIRAALGAKRAEIFAMILRQGLVLLAIGLVIGGLLAWQVTRLIQPHLFGVQGGFVSVYVLSGLVLAGATLLALLRPSLKAIRMHPMDSLRVE